jgi:predicted dehydrogenase
MTVEISRRSMVAATGAGLALASASRAAAQGANDRIRIGVIGCGGYGNVLAQQALWRAAEHNIEIAALCDVWSVNLNNLDTAVRAGQRRRPRLFRRHADLLERGGVDAVMIATPDHNHRTIMLDALRAGKDVYVEKPLATTIEHANELVDAVKAGDRVIQLGNQRRSDARHHAGAQFVQSGALGLVTEIDTGWNDSSPRWGRDFSNARAEDIDWEAFLDFLPPEPFNAQRFRRWQTYRDFSAGPQAALGAHLIDVGTWFMDDPLPVAAIAHGGNFIWKDGRQHPDTLRCTFEYPKGFLLNFSTRLGNARPMPEATFYGTKGTFDTQSWTARGDSGGTEALPAPIVVGVPGPPAPPQGQPYGPPMRDPHMVNWLTCLRSRARTNAPVEVGYAHSVASIMALQSQVTGQRLLFDREARTIRAG